MRAPVRFTPQHPLRKVFAAFNIAAIATLATVGLHYLPLTSGTMSRLDDTLYDRLYHCRKFEGRTGGPIVIVAGDDKSMVELAKHGVKFPFPRNLWGGAAQYAESMHARAVVIDMTFEGPSGNDEYFASQLDSIHIPVIIATTVDKDGKPQIFAPRTKRPPVFGAANILKDAVVRDYKPVVEGMPSLALRTVQMLGITPPRWANKTMRLHYYGPGETDQNQPSQSTYRYVSASAVFSASQNPSQAARWLVTPDMFRDKIVLFGSIGQGMYDLKSSPWSDLYPGVEVQATAIDNLIDGQTVQTIPPLPVAVATFVLAFISGLGVLFPRRTTLKLAASLAVVLVLVLVAIAMFRAEQIRWVPLVTPLTALIATIITAFAWSYLKEDRQRRFVVKALSQYLSPEIAALIERSTSALELGGERREITVIFTDLQGFTDLSESMAPEQLATVINYYMTEMSGVILSTNGTVAQYLGDGIMAFWSAPILQSDHAIRACRAALGMRKRETEIIAEMAALGAKNVVTRIGVNTGQMVFGNLGSQQKFSYGVMGDNVNLGSRLEGANKLYGSRILVAESTALAAKDHFVFRRLDDLRVKGKLKAVGVYELMAEGQPVGDLAAQVEGYSAAFPLYQSQQWDKAEAILKELLLRCPDDKPAAALLKRVEKLRHDPPGADWDGVYVAKDK
ncbi:MAG TPA: adenylate/guanylate cyclase domain-containing protein [Tepidisphaeraceae bacterium]|nr:adenylate/guanylate cyclase domain-containing protein [Tepidisphaeraceae bacterium]